MVCRDLQIVPAPGLPEELTLRPVRRLLDDAPDGVPLQDAIQAAMLADPRIDDRLDVFADNLRSLPAATRLFAAVDDDGVVRATSGSVTLGFDATVFFVNTDPGWRGRGIGRAMSAEALRAARASGAHRACLDATDAGRRIYSRLGFEAVTAMTRFVRGS
jgi:GNAT superfamily N-acetyltransferase